ncbi:MAG: hypothetical protein WBE47_00475 [Candidatus Acidiferrales bacterium]
MRWLKKWWWLLLVIATIASVIGWEEKHCQAQADQCKAAYSAQARSGKSIFWLTPDQRASERQAITAACEPNSYFCRLFSAANLPSMLLVLVGIFGIWAAIRTLNSIEYQTHLMHRSLVFQFRPKIIVRQMSLNFDENNPESRKWNIVGAIFNSGGTRTVIKKIRIVVFYRVEPHVRQQDGKMVEISPKPCKQEITIIAEIVLQAGDSKDFTLDLNSEINDRITYLADSAKNHLTNPQLVGVISLRGEIEYFDEIGTRRPVGISRELDFLSKRFTVSDDSDFEYAD